MHLSDTVNVSSTDARYAKTVLKATLQGKPWYRGIGLGKAPNGLQAVKVNVAALTPEVRAAIPPFLGTVPILVEAVGDIVAQG